MSDTAPTQIIIRLAITDLAGLTHADIVEGLNGLVERITPAIDNILLAHENGIDGEDPWPSIEWSPDAPYAHTTARTYDKPQGSAF